MFSCNGTREGRCRGGGKQDMGQGCLLCQKRRRGGGSKKQKKTIPRVTELRRSLNHGVIATRKVKTRHQGSKVVALRLGGKIVIHYDGSAKTSL